MSAQLYKRSVVPGGTITAITPALGGIKNMSELNAMSAKLGENMRQVADNIFSLDFEKNIRSSLEKIYENNKDNPQGFVEQSKSFWEEAQDEVPFHLATQSDATFTSASLNYEAKTKRNFEEAQNNKMQMSALEYQEQVVDDIVKASKELLVFDSLSPDASQSLQAAAANQTIEQSLQSLKKTMSVPGVDGRPLFSAEAQFRTLNRAQEKMGIAAATGWMEAQPDKVSAYKAWKNDQLSLRVRDEKGNIQSIRVRDRFNSDVLEKMDKDFLHEAKHQLSEFRQGQVLEAKMLKEFQKKAATDYYVKAQDGTLTVSEVDLHKDDLQPKDFIALRKLAAEAESGASLKSDPNVILDLNKRIIGNEDVSGQINQAVEDKKLSIPDAVSLLKQNSGADDVGKDPIEEGRKHLIGTIGVNKLIASDLQTATAANAEREYFDRVEEFKIDKKRSPSRREANELAEGVGQRFALLEDDKKITSLAKPDNVPNSFRLYPKYITLAETVTYQKARLAFYVDKYAPLKEGETARSVEESIKIFQTNPQIKEMIKRDRQYQSDNKFFTACRTIAERNVEKAKQKEGKK